mmetsp:Transcript_2033/g.2881  ORF Transcript_2033/g.2881 Transcript_2033/m.2881 type:complete len:251 (-) Transcript_2033:58-810(-)
MGRYYLSFFFLLIVSFHHAIATDKNDKNNSASYVAPASPFGAKISFDDVATGYGLYDSNKRNKGKGPNDPNHLNDILFTKTRRQAKTKKRKGKSDDSKKVQVKLLKNVNGTGEAGDIVLVSSSFFYNKLRPSKSAQIVSKDMKVRGQKKTDVVTAMAMKDLLEGFNVLIQRKSGSDGRFTDGIGSRVIMEELSKQLPNKLWKSEDVKLISVLDDNGKRFKGYIKGAGRFVANVQLAEDIVGELKFLVEAI